MNLSESYRRKITNVDQLYISFGPKGARTRRNKKIVMCHGVFDLVHPGHIRHLLYAKSKADILIVSISPDIHVKKALYRPFVPQDLRALNLAALEMVDYVLIDTEPTPLNTLTKLQPDFYAKGYEYQNRGEHSLTRQEVNLVESYGGEVIFTPGDVVYSSSAIIEASPPDLKLDKLLMLMETEKLSFSDLHKALDSFKGIKAHVVGDTIVDRLTYTTLIGGMSKTPTPSVRIERFEDFIGGAAIVALHLAAAGAEVTLSTVMGDDSIRHFVCEGLDRAGVRNLNVIDHTRPTTLKNTFVCDDYRLLKVDTVDNRSISDGILANFSEQIMNTETEAIVFSDFRHGIFNQHTIKTLQSSISREWILKAADSQVASRWGNILDFKNFDLITPNEREARFALGDQDTGVMPLVERLHKESNSSTVIMKLGEHGVITCSGPKPDFRVLDSFARRAVDPVGAGDALLAYAVLALTSNENSAAATILGTLAAGLECEVDGNIPISKEDVTNRLRELES